MASSNPAEWDTILSASQKNNANEVRRLIEEGRAPSNHANVVGQTALHIASLWGSVEALQVLIEKGADVNAQNRIAGMTPLHCAIRGTFQSFHDTHPRRLECVKLLLDAGADPSICDAKDKDAEGCIDDLLKEAALRGLGNIDVEAKEMREAIAGEKSKLLSCTEELNIDGVRDCLCDKIKVGEWNKALVCAVDSVRAPNDDNIEKAVAIIHALLGAESNADVSDSMQSTKDTCLETICSIVNSISLSPSVLAHLSAIAKDLLSHNAEPNVEIQMMLPDSARKGRLEMIQFLVEVLGVDANYRGRQDMTALHFAARGGKVDVVKWMLESCPAIDKNAVDGAGKKPVDYAIANGKQDIVALLEI